MLRIGRPDVIAASILAATTNGFMTGSILAIDGGGADLLKGTAPALFAPVVVQRAG